MAVNKIIVFLLFFGCVSVEQAKINRAYSDRHTFFSPSLKEGHEFINSQNLQMKKIDTVMWQNEKIYIFYYKEKYNQ